MPAAVKQLFRFGQVGRVLERVRIEATRLLSHGAVGLLPETGVDALDHFLVGEGVAHRLPRLGRCQGTGLGQRVIDDLGAGLAIDLEGGVCFELLDGLRQQAEPVRDVDFGGLNQLAERLRLSDDADHDLIKVFALPAGPVAIVLFHQHLLAGLKIGDLVRTGAGALGVGHHPGIPEVAVLLVLHRHLDVDNLDAIGAAHGRLEEGLRLAKIKHDSRGIRRGDLGWIGHEPGDNVVRALLHRQ